MTRPSSPNVVEAAHRGAWFEPRGLPDEPTSALPGSREKVMVMADRAEAGVDLWHPGDRNSDRLPKIRDLFRWIDKDEESHHVQATATDETEARDL